MYKHLKERTEEMYEDYGKKDSVRIKQKPKTDRLLIAS